MPTAVERLLDSFLKFDTADEQLKLDNAFQKIDEAFLKLSSVNGDGFNFLKIEHELQGPFNVIGQGFLKVGIDFHKVDTAENLTGNFVVKLLGDHKIGDLLPAVQVDFKALDLKIDAVSTDLKIVGVDFLKLDSSPNQQVFDHKVQTASVDCRKAGGDAASAGGAFLKLGEDFLTLGDRGGENSSPLDLAYKEFGGELMTIGQTFDTLAADFLKLGEALHGGGGGAGDGANTIGGTLTLLYQQFHFLDAEFVKLGDGSVRLIDALSSQAPPTGGTTDGPPVLVDTTQHGGGSGHG